MMGALAGAVDQPDDVTMDSYRRIHRQYIQRNSQRKLVEPRSVSTSTRDFGHDDKSFVFLILGQGVFKTRGYSVLKKMSYISIT